MVFLLRQAQQRPCLHLFVHGQVALILLVISRNFDIMLCSITFIRALKEIEALRRHALGLREVVLLFLRAWKRFNVAGVEYVVNTLHHQNWVHTHHVVVI